MRVDRKCVWADTETQLFFNCGGHKTAERRRNSSAQRKKIYMPYTLPCTHIRFICLNQKPLFSECICFFTVITATLISAAMRDQSILATFSIMHLYKEGSLAIQQAGKTMSTKVTVLCKNCPLVRRGKYLYTNLNLDSSTKTLIVLIELITAPGKSSRRKVTPK